MLSPHCSGSRCFFQHVCQLLVIACGLVGQLYSHTYRIVVQLMLFNAIKEGVTSCRPEQPHPEAWSACELSIIIKHNYHPCASVICSIYVLTWFIRSQPQIFPPMALLFWTQKDHSYVMFPNQAQSLSCDHISGKVWGWASPHRAGLLHLFTLINTHSQTNPSHLNYDVMHGGGG